MRTLVEVLVPALGREGPPEGFGEAGARRDHSRGERREQAAVAVGIGRSVLRAGA